MHRALLARYHAASMESSVSKHVLFFGTPPESRASRREPMPPETKGEALTARDVLVRQGRGWTFQTAVGSWNVPFTVRAQGPKLRLEIAGDVFPTGSGLPAIAHRPGVVTRGRRPRVPSTYLRSFPPPQSWTQTLSRLCKASLDTTGCVGKRRRGWSRLSRNGAPTSRQPPRIPLRCLDRR
jgi:hypothetical protein